MNMGPLTSSESTYSPPAVVVYPPSPLSSPSPPSTSSPSLPLPPLSPPSLPSPPPPAGSGGSRGHVTGTSAVDPKLLFPVDGLVAYSRENHGLVADGENHMAHERSFEIPFPSLSLSLSLPLPPPPPLSEPPLIRQFKHGQSNPTYYIEYAGAQLVLRKKPVRFTSFHNPTKRHVYSLSQPGKLLPSAHAVEREYR